LKTIALAGNPNSGKTTIFNALTGLRQKVANYPGVTVEKKTGKCTLPDGTHVDVIDLPGTYSLISRSPDEQVAMEVLRGLRNDTPAPDVVVVVVDASNLQRNLYLVSQLIELGRPMVVALNMMDIAQRRGHDVSAAKLQELLGVPVVSIVAHKKQGIDELKRAIAIARVAPMPDWPLPDAMKDELLLVGGGLAILESQDAGVVGRRSEVGAAFHSRPTTSNPRRTGVASRLDMPGRLLAKARPLPGHRRAPAHRRSRAGCRTDGATRARRVAASLRDESSPRTRHRPHAGRRRGALPLDRVGCQQK
jgi:small GTP-binding protein